MALLYSEEEIKGIKIEIKEVLEEVLGKLWWPSQLLMCSPADNKQLLIKQNLCKDTFNKVLLLIYYLIIIVVDIFYFEKTTNRNNGFMYLLKSYNWYDKLETLSFVLLVIL